MGPAAGAAYYSSTPPTSRRDADGLVGHNRLEVEVSCLKSGEIDNRFHGGPGLALRLGDTVEVGICAGAVLVEPAAARLGEDARIAIPEYHHRALDQAARSRVPVLVLQKTALQCLVGNFLHPGVHRHIG